MRTDTLARHLNHATQRDGIATALTLLTPALQLFYAIDIPIGFLSLLSAVQIVQNYLQQTHADQIMQCDILHSEYELAQDAKENPTLYNDVLQCLESVLLDAQNTRFIEEDVSWKDKSVTVQNIMRAYFAWCRNADMPSDELVFYIQTKISMHLHDFSILENDKIRFSQVFLQIKQKSYTQKIAVLQQYAESFLAQAQNIYLPIQTLNVVTLLVTLSVHYSVGGVTQLLEASLNTTNYLALMRLSTALLHRFFDASKNILPFNYTGLARLRAVTQAAMSITLPHMARKSTQAMMTAPRQLQIWMENYFSERAVFSDLPLLTPMNARVRTFLDKNPYMVSTTIPTGETQCIVRTADGVDIPVQTHPDNPDSIATRAQWIWGDYAFYVSARGVLYAAKTIIPVTQPIPIVVAQPDAPARPIENIITRAVQDVALLSLGLAVDYKLLLALLWFSQFKFTRSEETPRDIQQQLDQYYNNVIAQVYINSNGDYASFKNTFWQIYQPEQYLENNYPDLSDTQKQYLIQQYNDYAQTSLQNFQEVNDYNRQFSERTLYADVIKGAWGRAVGMAFDYAEQCVFKVLPEVLVVGEVIGFSMAEGLALAVGQVEIDAALVPLEAITVRATWNMALYKVGPFLLRKSEVTLGLAAIQIGVERGGDMFFDYLFSPVPPAGQICASVVFEPDTLDVVMPYLRAYAKSSSAADRLQLKDALTRQLIDIYAGSVSESAEAVREAGVEYYIDNAAPLVLGYDSGQQYMQLASQFDPNAALGSLTDFNAVQQDAMCTLTGSPSCDNAQYAGDFSKAINPFSTASIQSRLGVLHQQIAQVHADTLKQQNKQQIQIALHDISVGFQFAASIAMIAGDPQLASKINALGQITVNLLQMLSDLSKHFSQGLTALASLKQAFGKMIPYLEIITEVMQIFSILTAGKSTDEVILDNLQVIEQDLQAISKQIFAFEQQMQKDFAMLDQEIEENFKQLFENLMTILHCMISGQEISQTLAHNIKTLLMAFRMQVFGSFEDVLNKQFIAAQADVALIDRTPNAYPNDPTHVARNNTLAAAAREFYLHAVIYAKQSSTSRNGLMEFTVGADSQQDMKVALSDYLSQVPAEYSIAFLQRYFENVISRPSNIVLANGQMWREGVLAFAHVVLGYGLIPFPYVETQLTDMMRTGIELIRFLQATRASKSLWKDILTNYGTATNEITRNASTLLLYAWYAYVSLDPVFSAQYLDPLRDQKKQLLEEIGAPDAQYSDTPMQAIFSGPGPSSGCNTCGAGSESLRSAVNNAIFDSDDYMRALQNNTELFSATDAFLNFFNRSAWVTFPIIAFNAGDISGPPLNLTGLVIIPDDIQRAQYFGNTVKFTYVLHTIPNADYPVPTFELTGTYTLNGQSITFFTGQFLLTNALTGGIAGYVSITPDGDKNVVFFNKYTIWLCTTQYPDMFNGFDCRATFYCGDCDQSMIPFGAFNNPNSIQCPVVGYCSAINFPTVVSQMLFACKPLSDVTACLGQNTTYQIAYEKLAKTIYHAVLTNAFISNYSKTISPIQNTLQRDAKEVYALAQYLDQQNQQLLQLFFQTLRENPQTPGYQAFAQVLLQINGAYNLLNSFLSLVFPDYLTGVHSANEKPLCTRINPWGTDGIALNYTQHGIVFSAKPGNVSSSVFSQFGIPIQQKTIHLVWMPLSSQDGRIRIFLGEYTLADFQLPIPQFSAPCNTRIVARNHTRKQQQQYYARTACGSAVNVAHFNETVGYLPIKISVTNASNDQDIQIFTGTSVQHNTTLHPHPSFWKCINTPSNNHTYFSNEGVTFHSVNHHTLLGSSILQTAHRVGVMNTHIYIAWRAHTGMHENHLPYNMTVNFDIGQQKRVGSVHFGLRQTALQDTWYYTTLTVTPDKIFCTTCLHEFSDQGGVAVYNSTQQNNFVSDFATLAIRISDSDRSDGHQWTTVKTVHIVGFEASILPQLMPAQAWIAHNSTHGIERAPDSLSITIDTEYPQAILTSANTHALHHREIFLTWRLDGEADVVLQLKGQPIITFSNASHDWQFTRVMVFDKYVEITTASQNYDLYANTKNVTTSQVPIKLGTGTIAWVMQNTSQTARFTVSACTLQDLANTVLGRKHFGLLTRDGMMNAILGGISSPNAQQNTTDLSNVSSLFKSLEVNRTQLLEILLALTDLKLYPAEPDPRTTITMQKLREMQMLLVANRIKTHRPTFFRPESRTHTPTLPIPPNAAEEEIESLQAEFKKLQEALASNNQSTIEQLTLLLAQVVKSAHDNQLAITAVQQQLKILLYMMLGILGGGFVVIPCLRKVPWSRYGNNIYGLFRRTTNDNAPLLDASDITEVSSAARSMSTVEGE